MGELNPMYAPSTQRPLNDLTQRTFAVNSGRTENASESSCVVARPFNAAIPAPQINRIWERAGSEPSQRNMTIRSSARLRFSCSSALGKWLLADSTRARTWCVSAASKAARISARSLPKMTSTDRLSSESPISQRACSRMESGSGTASRASRNTWRSSMPHPPGSLPRMAGPPVWKAYSAWTCTASPASVRRSARGLSRQRTAPGTS